MRFEVTTELLEEMANTIVDCNLDRDEAFKYMKSCVRETLESSAVDAGLLAAIIVTGDRNPLHKINLYEPSPSIVKLLDDQTPYVERDNRRPDGQYRQIAKKKRWQKN